MRTRQDYLLNPTIIAEDRAALDALRDITDYAPRNLAYGVATLNALEAALRLAELETERARQAFDTSRRRLIQAHWSFHNGILGAKGELLTQFGPDSDFVPAVGLKRKSDRKRPTRSRKASAAQAGHRSQEPGARSQGQELEGKS